MLLLDAMRSLVQGEEARHETAKCQKLRPCGGGGALISRRGRSSGSQQGPMGMGSRSPEPGGIQLELP